MLKPRPAILLCALALSAQTTDLPPAVPGFPVGRCVKVANITAPEDAASVGFEYVELALPDVLPMGDAEFAAVVKRMRRLGIPSLAGYGFVPSDLKVVGPGVDSARIDRDVQRGVSRAEALGLKMVVFGNLNNRGRSFPEGFNRGEAHKQLRDFLTRAATEARKRNITVLLEPMPVSQTNMINTVAEALDFIGSVNHPNLELLVDFGYITQSREDLAIMHKAAPHIRMVEIQNPNGRVYPRSADEADYAGFFRALKKGGYYGGFSVHGAPKEFFVDAPRAISVLRRLAATMTTE